MNFPAKKRLSQFLNISIIYHRTKNQKKLLSHSWEKCQTDTRTENGDFTGPSVGWGSKKLNLPKVTWVYLSEKNFLWKTGSDIWTIFHWVVIIAYQYFNSLDQFYFFDLTTTLRDVLQNLYKILEK